MAIPKSDSFLPGRRALAAAFLLALCGPAAGQTQIQFTNPAAANILRGNYNPADYRAATVIDNIAAIAPDMAARVSRDSLESYLTRLVSFHNRNSGSDTVSTTRGIGAARRWVHSKFQEFSAQSGGRLVVSYLQFTQNLCNVTSHRNVLAVLPGRNAQNHGVIFVMGHMDSRCESNCDITCRAHGAVDDGSGTVLAMELARVLSKYTFNHTLVFMANTGEEQGTAGAGAMASYCQSNNVPVKAVLNNDIVAGIICGQRSSAPSCSPPGSLDSVNVRIFSASINFSMNKALGRFVKDQYDHWIKPTARVPMNIRIMDPQDRSGRGGDHNPFAARNFPAIRFTSANENGDGSSSGGTQHTTRDLIREEGTNRDLVNFDYLARNTVINGIGMVVAAQGLQPPAFTLTENAQRQTQANVTQQTSPAGAYKVAVRDSGNNAFALIYSFNGNTFVIPGTRANTTYYAAMASLDANGGQSLFSQEQRFRPAVNGPVPVRRAKAKAGPRLQAAQVNADRITWKVLPGPKAGQNLTLRINDARGKTLHSQAFRSSAQEMEIALFADRLAPGRYEVTLEAEGKVLARQPLQHNPGP